MNETYYNGKNNIITPEMDLTTEGFKIRKKFYIYGDASRLL